MTAQEFFSLCLDALDEVFVILDLICSHWYFAVLFAVGLIGLGFELVGALNDTNDTLNG